MCETRHELRVARNEYKTVKPDDAKTMPKQRGEPRQRGEKVAGNPRVRGEGPRDGDKKEWTLVGKNANDSARPKNSSGPKVVKSTQGSTIITIQSK